MSRQARLRAVIWNEYQVTNIILSSYIHIIKSSDQLFFLIKNKYDQVSVYNVFVERGNVAVLQCGVPASVRDSVEVRKREIAIMRCDSKYTEAEEVQV